MLLGLGQQDNKLKFGGANAFPFGEGGRALSEVGRGKYRFAELLLYVQSSSALFRPLRGHLPQRGRLCSAKEQFSELVCHCEEGEARRGNPHPLWRSDDDTSPKENGLHHRHSLRSPHQCVHWLTMTSILVLLMDNIPEQFHSRGPKDGCQPPSVRNALSAATRR